jgi:hypothetical protein
VLTRNGRERGYSARAGKGKGVRGQIRTEDGSRNVRYLMIIPGDFAHTAQSDSTRGPLGGEGISPWGLAPFKELIGFIMVLWFYHCSQ